MGIKDDLTLKQSLLKSKTQREKELEIINKALIIIESDSNWEIMLKAHSII